ncbi:peptidylprolyl isomerase [Thermodesulfovibrionales bacterium]|nr:peptidylprolyl isomerase [Thermodesulfovibrionales bacterium]
MLKKILLAVSIFMFVSAAPANSAILFDRIVAVVNMDVITWSDLNRVMRFEAPLEIDATKDIYRDKFLGEDEMAALKRLIDTRLKLQEAARVGISVTDRDIEMAIEAIKRRHGLTDEMFRLAIKGEGLTLYEYRKRLSEEIILARVVEQEVRRAISVTQEDIDKYLLKSKEPAAKTVWFNISHIFLKERDDKGQVEEMALDLYKKIQAGDDFSEIARQYSEGMGAEGGGALGFIRETALSRDFLDVLTAMKEGDVSKPFWSIGGIHIVKLVAKKTEVREDLREAVRQKLTEREFSSSYRNWIRKLRKMAHIDIRI